jgi:hypothetical protein
VIEIRNTSQEPVVLRLSTSETTTELAPGATAEIAEYEPGITLEFWPKFQRNLPRVPRSGVRRDDAQADPV